MFDFCTNSCAPRPPSVRESHHRAYTLLGAQPRARLNGQLAPAGKTAHRGRIAPLSQSCLTPFDIAPFVQIESCWPYRVAATQVMAARTGCTPAYCRRWQPLTSQTMSRPSCLHRAIWGGAFAPRRYHSILLNIVLGVENYGRRNMQLSMVLRQLPFGRHSPFEPFGTLSAKCSATFVRL